MKLLNYCVNILLYFTNIHEDEIELALFSNNLNDLLSK